MHRFFAEQGASLRTQEAMPADAPRGAWGVADAAALAFARADVEAQPAGARYVVFLSLTNHHPYASPPDLAPADAAAFDAFAASAPGAREGSERRRIVTHRYTDAAVRGFVEGIANGPLGPRSVFVIQADHSTGERPAWTAPNGLPARADGAFASRIPLLLLFPSRREPGVVRLKEPVSENDVPRLLLTVLKAHPRIKAAADGGLAATLGGQRFIPGARALTPFSGSVVWGINARSAWFGVSASGLVAETPYTAVPPRFDRPPRDPMPGGDAVLAALGRYLRRHATPCAGFLARRTVP